MPTKINPASRVLRLIEQAPSFPDNTQTLEVWAKLFGIEDGNPHRRVVAVGELVHASLRELDLIADGMKAAAFPSALYDTVLDKLRHAFSPMLLPGTWNQARQYFGADVLTSLAYCSEILPDEETQISDADLSEIRSRLSELRESLVGSEVSDRLRKLITHHIELIERALCEYPIAGAKALREAGHTAHGEIIEARDEIAAARQTEPVSKLEKTWKKINEAADVAFKAEKIAQLGQRAWDAISNML
jgi:hypothetical protein